MRAAELKAYAESPRNWAELAEAFNSSSRFARLRSIRVAVAGRNAFVRVECGTGDAMGMNMVSKGTASVLGALRDAFPDMRVVSMSGNYCADKKATAVNWIHGRGKSVVCEATIPGHVVRSPPPCPHPLPASIRTAILSFPFARSMSGNYCADKKATAVNWIHGRGKSVVCEATIPGHVVRSPPFPLAPFSGPLLRSTGSTGAGNLSSAKPPSPATRYVPPRPSPPLFSHPHYSPYNPGLLTLLPSRHPALRTLLPSAPSCPPPHPPPPPPTLLSHSPCPPRHPALPSSSPLCPHSPVLLTPLPSLPCPPHPSALTPLSFSPLCPHSPVLLTPLPSLPCPSHPSALTPLSSSPLCPHSPCPPHPSALTPLSFSPPCRPHSLLSSPPVLPPCPSIPPASSPSDPPDPFELNTVKNLVGSAMAGAVGGRQRAREQHRHGRLPGDGGGVVESVLKTTVAALVELNTVKNLVGSAMAGAVGGSNAHASNIVTAVFLATGQDPAQNVESLVVFACLNRSVLLCLPIPPLIPLLLLRVLAGSAMAGAVGGCNAHASNIVTAVFLATGQDPAQNVESSQCLTLLEAANNGEDLHASVTLPAIEVGTVGGGTFLAPQCLTLLESANNGTYLHASVPLPAIVVGTVGGGTFLAPQAAALALLGVKGAHRTQPGLAAGAGGGGSSAGGELSLCSGGELNSSLSTPTCFLATFPHTGCRFGFVGSEGRPQNAAGAEGAAAGAGGGSSK
ncbi:unnamed protein product [Closterium sp. Naga37s-1]|nr:unnamed protein product [Closterium sp. Naga37s-1]